MQTMFTATTARSASILLFAFAAMIFASGCGLTEPGGGYVGYWQGPADYDYKLDGEKYSTRTKHSVVEIAPTESGVAIIVENFGDEGFNCTLFAELDGDKLEVQRDYCSEWEGESLFVKGEGELRGDDELDLDLEFEFEESGIIWASGQVSFSLDRM